MNRAPATSGSYRPTLARIDLDAFGRNVRRIMRHSGTALLGVIKADAYGHGAVACARVLQDCGAAYAGVALAEEALELRAAGLNLPVLVLGRAPASALPALVEAEITCTLTCAEDALRLQQTAAVRGLRARAHVKVDTGMSRLGIAVEEAGAFWDTLHTCGNLEVEGLFTHFASADSGDLSFARAQAEAFSAVLRLLADRRCRPRYAHACASSGLHTMPGAFHDLVRPGIALYGGTQPCCTAFTTEPVMQLESRIAAVRWFEAGRSISYGNTYTCPDRRRIAVLPIGYADGLPRALSNRGVFLVHGALAPITGRVCMDMTMIDVTDIPRAVEGSPAVLFGNPALAGEACPTVNQVAELVDTIPYEILCGISRRVPRVFNRG